MSRDPFEAQTSRDGYDSTGGPLGFLKTLVIFVVFMVGLVAVIWGVEAVASQFMPGWAVFPVALVVIAILGFGGV